jgi:hypothetical protein
MASAWWRTATRFLANLSVIEESAVSGSSLTGSIGGAAGALDEGSANSPMPESSKELTLITCFFR